MDPGGPWSSYAATYNRLTGAAAAGFPGSSASGTGEFVASHLASSSSPGISHQPGSGLPSTTSQLLLQAAHTTSFAGQLTGPGAAPSFSPGGFLPPSSVMYDAVFSSLFPTPKPAHYSSSLNVNPHRQALTQANVAKQVGSEVDTGLRDGYSATHHQSGTFFDHHAAVSSPSLSWTHQGNVQIPSPFGILPHESVTSPGPVPSKTSTTTYENAFSPNFSTSNSQISTDFNKSSTNYGENARKKIHRPTSPTKDTAPSASTTSSFFQSIPVTTTTFTSSDSPSRNSCPTIPSSFPSSKSQLSNPDFSADSKNFSTNSSPLHQQQTCIVSNSSSGSAKDFLNSQPRSSGSNFLDSNSVSQSTAQIREKHSQRQNFVSPSRKSPSHRIQTKAQSKVYSDLTSNADHCNENSLESSQSSPISFAMIDTVRQGLNYATSVSGVSCNRAPASPSKLIPGTQQSNSNPSVQTPSTLPQTHFHQILNQQANPNSPSYGRHYSNSDSTEYHSRTKPIASSEAAYSERMLSSNSSLNGSDSGVVVPRRPSPLQAHSQASPLGHVPSPAYPMYNSPLTTMSSPSPIQQHTSEGSSNQCSTNNIPPRHVNTPNVSQVAPLSPIDVTLPRPASQGPGGQVAYSSVIIRALTPSKTGAESFTNDLRRVFDRVPHEYAQKQGSWDQSERHGLQSRLNSKYNCISLTDPYNSGSVGDISNSSQIPTGASIHQQIQHRQQPYFDSNQSHQSQVSLQDLSNCHGSPMSLVKTLQQQSSHQQSLHNDPIKTLTEEPCHMTNKSSKRRKSSDKAQSIIHSAAISENVNVDNMYLSSRVRIPPPAHHNVNQQQNGGFYDFDRWGLPPPPPSKMYSGSHGSFGSQTPLTHPNNFVSTPAHHHQPLMVPHHSAAPPPGLSYIPTFQAPPSGQHTLQQHQEFVHSADINPISYEPSSPGNSFSAQESQDDQPKVIVPNIEEELGHLAENIPMPSNIASGVASAKIEGKIVDQKAPLLSNSSTGFMASYMKFLQGDRESSPPPQNRATRKPTWTKPNIYQPSEKGIQDFSNNSMANLSNTTFTISNTLYGDNQPKDCKQSTTYDPQDDPRYFPLPKSDDNRKSFSDSDDDLESSEGEKEKIELQKKGYEQERKERELIESGKKEKSKRGRDYTKVKGKVGKFKLEKDIKEKNKVKESDGSELTNDDKQSPKLSLKPGSKAKCKFEQKYEEVLETCNQEESLVKERKIDKIKRSKYPKDRSIYKKKQEQSGIDPLLLPPRREVARRKAKEKIAMKQLLDQDVNLDDFETEETDLADSDSDPAWTPTIKDSTEEEGRRRSSRRGRPLISNRKKSRSMSSANEDDLANLENQDEFNSNQFHHRTKQQRGRPKTHHVKSPQPLTSDSLSMNASIGEPIADTNFKSGEFIVMKTDLGEEYPPIWRIDGKTLLQKYEPFEQDGKTLYRSISTYSAWTPQNRHIFQLAPVRFVLQNRLETIIEFLKGEMCLDDHELICKLMAETLKYQDHFEVYIQTLISQALDSNFLNEIFQEQDDYFLSNVKIIDDVTEEKKQQLLSIAQWPDAIQAAVGTWPCFNVIPEPDGSDQPCAACGKGNVSTRVQVYGQPYNSTTLEGCPPDPTIAAKKDFETCSFCVGHVELYNKVSHQKYLMYIECAKRVAEKRSSDHRKDTTMILNELLADEAWLDQLFKIVRYSWAEIDKMGRIAQKEAI